jgi:hypothetical protein
MYVLRVEIANFRGIKSADWTFDGTCLCLIGPNDSTKTTLLDAIEMALSSSPYLNMSEVDFHNAVTDDPIEIRVTVGGIPPGSHLWTDSKYGFLKRGWKKVGGLIDEPEDEDCEPVLTIRLRVSSTYEPEWSVMAYRNLDGVPISPQSRAQLGVVRLGDDVDRDLAWGRYSVLTRLTGGDAAEALIADAQRKLRSAAKEGNIDELNKAARTVEEAAKKLGVRPATGYQAALDSKLVTFRQGAFALHDGDIPVRAAGLGTRRLTALAIQRASVPDGAIVLIDEVEHGLEPHRIRRLLRNLRHGLDAGTREIAEPKLGQVIMTTHSAVPLLELDREHIRVIRPAAGRTEVLRPSENTQGVLRRLPSSFLAQKVLVCEGATEVGLCRRLAEHWRHEHQDLPVEHFGVEIADGGGSNAPNAAVALADLKYEVAYLGDSDEAKQSDIEKMQTSRIKVVLWTGKLCTEERIALDLIDKGFEELLRLACAARGCDSIAAVVAKALSVAKPADPSQLTSWLAQGVRTADLRTAFGTGAKGTDERKGWFKSIDGGRALGEILVRNLDDMKDSCLWANLKEIENWCYDGGTG